MIMIKARHKIEKIILGAILMLIPLCGYCQEPKQYLQLSIKSDKEVYEIDEAIWIEVLISNKSGKDCLLTSPGLQVSCDNFKNVIYAPVKFINNSLQDNPNERIEVVLKPKETKIIKYNLYDLKWDNIISSLWASKKFDTYVQPGIYSIFFLVNNPLADRKLEYVPIESNRISIKLLRHQ